MGNIHQDRPQHGSVFATLKLLAVWLTCGPVVGLLGIPYTLIRRNVTRLFHAAMWVVRAGIRAAGIRVKVDGLENVPAGRACIFMSNHVSNMDPPLLMPEIPGRFSILLKKELMSIPILGTAMRLGSFVPVARGSSPETARATVAAAAAALAAGLHIIVFPEGTRSPNGRLSAFKKGTFFLAQQTRAPIIPVAITGTVSMLPKGTRWLRPGNARIQMLQAIHPGNYATRDELMTAVKYAITQALPPEMKPLA